MSPKQIRPYAQATTWQFGRSSYVPLWRRGLGEDADWARACDIAFLPPSMGIWASSQLSTKRGLVTGLLAGSGSSQTRNLYYRDSVLLPSLTPSRQARLRSQAKPQAAAWLSAIPSWAGTHAPAVVGHANCPAATTPLAPDPRAKPLRRRRSTRPWLPNRHVRRPRLGVPTQRFVGSPGENLRAACVGSRAVRVGREAVGSESQVVPQQLLARTTGVRAGDQCRLAWWSTAPQAGGDATMVSLLTRDGEPHPAQPPVTGLRRVSEKVRVTRSVRSGGAGVTSPAHFFGP